MIAFVSHCSALFSMDPLCALSTNLREAGQKMIQHFQTTGSTLAGIVIVSAHWQSQFDGAYISSGCDGTSWKTLHDHPAAALHNFSYSAVHSEALSDMIRTELTSAGVNTQVDPSKTGFDHGAWLALHSLWNDAAPSPVVQVSISGGDVFKSNYQLGKALSGLRSRGILIVTSGGLTHNQEEFRKSYFNSESDFVDLSDWSLVAQQKRREAALRAEPFAESVAFDKRLRHAVISANINEVINAHLAPDFPKVHPEPSHWLPLIVALGCLQQNDESVVEVHAGFQHGLSEASFVWGIRS